jgi:hypothetical protein
MTPLEAWYREFMMQYGEPPNMGPTSDYDYAKALQWGVQPQRYAQDGMYHWPSKTPAGEWLKKPDHPTHWMEDYYQAYGRDPMGFVLEQLLAEQAQGPQPQGLLGLLGGMRLAGSTQRNWTTSASGTRQ